MNRIQLNKKIDVFLKDKRESRGGWAEVASEDMEQLDEIVGGLIDLKSQRDPDGDRTIEYAIVNRREGFWPVSPFRVPYDIEIRHVRRMMGDVTRLLRLIDNKLFVIGEEETP